jgi:hypothetical protein
MQHYDDDSPEFLAKPPATLRPLPLVMLPCPDCQHRVYGQGEKHARELLLIHQEGTCEGAEGGER